MRIFWQEEQSPQNRYLPKCKKILIYEICSRINGKSRQRFKEYFFILKWICVHLQLQKYKSNDYGRLFYPLMNYRNVIAVMKMNRGIVEVCEFFYWITLLFYIFLTWKKRLCVSLLSCMAVVI